MCYYHLKKFEVIISLSFWTSKCVTLSWNTLYFTERRSNLLCWLALLFTIIFMKKSLTIETHLGLTPLFGDCRGFMPPQRPTKFSCMIFCLQLVWISIMYAFWMKLFRYLQIHNLKSSAFYCQYSCIILALKIL